MLGGPLPPSLFSIGKGFIFFFLHKKEKLVGHLRFVVVFIFIKIITENSSLLFLNRKKISIDRLTDGTKNKTKNRFSFVLQRCITLSISSPKVIQVEKCAKSVYIPTTTTTTRFMACVLFLLLLFREREREKEKKKEESPL